MYEALKQKLAETKENLRHHNPLHFSCDVYLCYNIVLCVIILEIKVLNPTGHVMHQQFNMQQLYVLPTLCLCVLYLSENKQRLVPLTA